MNKRILGTVLVIAGLASTARADNNSIFLLGIDENPGLGLNLENGISADVGPVGVGFRGDYTDEKNATKYKSKSNRKKYTGTCDCNAIQKEMDKLKKNKDTNVVLHLGIRNHHYKKLQQQQIDCNCTTSR